ncbi:glycosyltransferase family 4 protein [bacterium]|nr:glycosyltransferase family 4 protein [bacterium]
MNLKQLLVIGTTWPEPSTTAAGNRMLQLLHFFKREGYQITFSSTAAESDRSLDLDALGIHKAQIQLNHHSFDSFITNLQPSIVLFDRFPMEEQFGWRVAEFAPQALRILDTEDLHSLRKTRETAFKKNSEWTEGSWLQADITKREIASIYRSDIALIISSYEMRLLKLVIKIDESLLLHLPFMVAPLTNAEVNALNSFKERKDFICVGNGKHAPNVDAIIWLKTEIWPLIRKQLPDVILNIYGAYLPERIWQFHNEKEGFLIHGWAQQVKKVMEDARVNLVPLRFGAGLKGKLLDAMLYGTPSITTALGAEGMYVEHDFPFNGAIVQTPEDFAATAISVYSDAPAWNVSQKKGEKIVNALFDKELHEARLRTKLSAVQDDINGHRTKNIVGSLLLHQTMASTKYMAKWIEEKNRG